jgi:hypothetical protein
VGARADLQVSLTPSNHLLAGRKDWTRRRRADSTLQVDTLCGVTFADGRLFDGYVRLEQGLSGWKVTTFIELVDEDVQTWWSGLDRRLPLERVPEALEATGIQLAEVLSPDLISKAPGLKP